MGRLLARSLVVLVVAPCWSSRMFWTRLRHGVPSRIQSVAHTSANRRAVFRDAIDRAQAVSPTDFLASGIVASAIGDRDFVDAAAGLGDFRRDFRLEAEAVLLDPDSLDDLAAKNLVAGFHVRQSQMRESIRTGPQPFVRDPLSQEHAGRPRTPEARTEYDVG